jgi:hypothetical protein
MSGSESKSNWFGRHKFITAVLIVAILAIVLSGGNSTKDKQNSSSSSPTPQSKNEKAPVKPAERQVKGTLVTIGAGSFNGGQDVAAGLYDVSTGGGQSGNFIVNEGAKVNEVLGAAGGFGVSKVRANISSGDVIKISGLSQVTFTPVSAMFVLSHATTTLYAGTFTVGEDIGQGKYVVTPGHGESGNFIVNEGAKINEVLGAAGGFGVPSVTVNLSKGDIIKLSGLNNVVFTEQ